MSFPAYPAYRDSGVPWLGQVPATWAVVPVKAVASCNDDVLPEDTPPDQMIEYVEISDVAADRGITGRSTMMFGEAPSRARRRVQRGDVIVSTVRTYLRAIATAPEDSDALVVSTGFAVFRPRRVEAGFLGYMFHAEEMIAEIIARSVGVSYPAINASDIARLAIPLPPPAEQRAIAAFLDRECGKIDALVAEQERLIALLKEKRQAVISHAVTKGLDPSAPMKDSGVAWLGPVPAHWEVVPIRGLAAPGRENFIDGDWIEAPYITDEGVRLIQTGNIGVGSYREQGFRFISEATFVDFRCTEVMPRDVLICRLAEPVGRACQAPDLGTRMITSVDVCILKPAPNVSAEFVVNLFSSAQYLAFMEGQCRGGTRDRVSRSFLGSVRVPLPPLEEQRAIVAALDQQCGKIDTLTTEAERAIALLKERRAALISAAVTGRIDVRGLVPAEEAKAA